MPIRTKRWNDPREDDDGHRLLICRYRPRGLPKGDETWDAWDTHLAPSKELLAAFHGKDARAGIDWSTYRHRYLREMRDQKQRIADLAKRSAASETITL